ncbi:MAG: excinuclease ABC subunit UvrC [Eubacteriales bacterium]|nr:excinuclease ABC subunit UvrC [Eubacteriales bacterium]
MNTQTLEYLKKKANALPLVPGVYLMKNCDGKIIYVGKSKKLKNRVSSYFVNTDHGIKTARMVSNVCDFSTILCDTEMEALALENTLIKKYSPKYNICLKDSKSYPYIKITGEEYPKIIMTRDRRDDGAVYLGPYSGTTIAKDAIETVTGVFRLPVCKRVFPRDIGKERPCLYKQMGRCIAPCTGEVSAEEYGKLISSARHVLEGNIKDTVKTLTDRMYRCADKELFEEASRLRDTISSLKSLKEKQKVIIDTDSDKDVWATYQGESCTVLTVLGIREGALNSKNEFVFSHSELFDEDAMASFIYDYYSDTRIPHEVLFSDEPGDETVSLISSFVKERSGGKSSVRTPKRGVLRGLCDMAKENAKEKAIKHDAEVAKKDDVLMKLSVLLSLEVVPDRIEAYDISNLASEHITAGMIVYADGGFLKSDYRQFKIRSIDSPDDYAAMREALTRRLSHIGDKSASLSKTPDLILIDGGSGHVNVAKEVLTHMGFNIPVFGMVKDDYHKTRAMTDGENEISIARENSVFSFVYKIQEEVHRYTVGVMSKAKRSTLKHSILERISGIGPTKAKTLLMRFGSVRNISNMSEDELLASNIQAKDAHNIAEYFKKDKSTKENEGYDV